MRALSHPSTGISCNGASWRGPVLAFGVPDKPRGRTMGTLSTTAWVLHDLGLAAGFGGPLFGEVALQKAVKSIPSPEDRERVLDRAWNTYHLVDAACLGLAGITWLAGRTRLSGREIDRRSHGLVIAKDALMSAALG